VVVDFVQLASYGGKSKSSGAISLLKDLTVDIRGKDVLICEDILDTGVTMDFLYKHLLASEPGSIKICTLIDKRERRQIQVEADYVCFKEAGFLVGFGLDYAEIYRNLPGIYMLNL
jgi:hypoxanthine phosphoribosyltransferase